MALLVITGTSGAGKGAIVSGLRARRPDLWYSVSATTRAPRPGERDEHDYFFITREDFERRRNEGGFLEWFEVYGELKGTPRQPVEQRLARGDDVLLEVDVQGALAVKERLPEAVLVFVRAPSRGEQRRRLERRANEEDIDVEGRLAAAEGEERLAGQFDQVVVNDDVDRAIDEIAGILDASRSSD